MLNTGDVKPDDLRAVIGELAATISGVRVEVGTTDSPRHPEYFIKLMSNDDPETFAIISATGSGWYQLTVNGGFWTGRADDQAVDPEEVREYLAQYVRAGLAYLDGSWSIRKSRFLRVATLSIQKGESVVNLFPRGRGSTNDYRL